MSDPIGQLIQKDLVIDNMINIATLAKGIYFIKKTNEIHKLIKH
jgi:hypothetical protein